MPFDAIFLTAVAAELRAQTLGCRVDKVQQPERDTVILHLRAPGMTARMLLSASSNHPRAHLTTLSCENPAQPPMFCMLLRKHLTGGRLASITQPPMERLLDFSFDCTDELGESVQKHLILELMGRNSNLVLTDGSGRVLDCLRRVDFEMSAERQLLPGLYYRLPPAQDKRNPFQTDADTIAQLLCSQTGQKKFDAWLLDTFGGISPLLCRELTFRLFGDIDADISALSQDVKQQAAYSLHEQFSALAGSEKTPVLLIKQDRLWDFTCIGIEQYGSFVRCEPQPGFSHLLDSFYGERDRAERLRQKTQTLRKLLTNLQNRTARKLELQKKELAGTHDRERLRRLGDIVTANLHAIGRGQSLLRAIDFYDPDMREIDIALNPALSPQQNAAKFYKDYQKAKTAERVLTEQIARGETELDYLGSVLEALARAESERDIQQIRAELESGGYLREQTQKKRMKLPPAKPMQFRSTEGYTILVGRNNQQNDLLTTKLAEKSDLWLHAQKIHGSHVIIACAGQTPSDETVTEAMTLAAYYSQSREGQNVPVDYTRVKNVKKPNGAKPGMVIYDRYATGYVTPDAALVERLKVEKS